MTTLATIVLVLALASGGTGGAVYAAQDDLPTGALYSVKLLSEDARLSLTADSATRTDLLLEFAQRRVQEMTALSAQSHPPLDPVATRLRAEIDAALQLAASADDATLNRALAQIQAQLENERQFMAQAQAGASGDAAPILEQAQTMLQDRQQLCQTGLADPQAFRDQLRDQTRDQDRLQTGTPQRGPNPDRTPEPIGTALGPGPRPTHLAEPTDGMPGGPNPGRTPEPIGTAQRGPDPSRTPEPIGTALGPGPMNTPAGPGPQNTPMGPGPQDTPMGSGPQETPAGAGPVNTPVGPGPMNTAAGPGPQNTPMGPGGPKP